MTTSVPAEAVAYVAARTGATEINVLRALLNIKSAFGYAEFLRLRAALGSVAPADALDEMAGLWALRQGARWGGVFFGLSDDYLSDYVSVNSTFNEGDAQ